MTVEPATVHVVRDLIEMVRESWGWLWLLMVPGNERRPGRAVDEDQAEVLEARGRQARAFRDAALREGRGALAAAPAPARLEILDVQTTVGRLVCRAAMRVAEARSIAFRGGNVPAVLDWLTGGGPLAVLVVDGDGTTWRAGPVDELHDHRDARALTDVANWLRTADRIAREAAGVVDEPRRPIEHRCPACGNRSLQLHHPTQNKRLWTVTCVRRSCRCVGPGCGCLRRDKRRGLVHVWTRAELSGPYGLAAAVDRAKLAREAAR